MHTVDLLARALRAAQRLGYRLRQECLDATASGACEINGQKWLFLDLTDSPLEQLHIVLEVLAAERARAQVELDPQLCGLLDARSAA